MKTKTKFKILLFILLVGFTGFYGFGFLYLSIALFLTDVPKILVMIVFGAFGFSFLDACVKLITCIADEIKKNKPVRTTER